MTETGGSNSIGFNCAWLVLSPGECEIIAAVVL